LNIECQRCKTRSGSYRRPRDTAIWKLEASLKCRACRKGRETIEIDPKILAKQLARRRVD
jgi:hypothetical protein